MKKMRTEFIDGAVKHSQADPKLAEKFWTQLEEFANYCFNKSHAACYGLISYWTAYLKAHYPEAFMAALMTSDQNDIDRVAIEINECKHMGITVLPPDVNEGFVEFAVVPGKKEIRFGMAAVKGVGVGAVEEILRTRDADGKFSSVEDFAKRVNTNRFNKKAWESLIKSGGFDSLANRSDLLFNLETIQAFASKLQKEALNGQTDLFGDLADSSQIKSTIALQTSPLKHSERERLAWERELMGLYISAHPLDNYDTYFEEQTVPLTQVIADFDGKSLIVGGLISTIRTIVTKNGSKMAFVGIEDKFDEAEIIVFPNLYKKVGSKLIRDAVIRVEGKVSGKDRNGNTESDAKIIADDIQLITDQELRDYKSTGQKMAILKNNEKVQTKRVILKPEHKTTIIPKKLYVNINDPDDYDSLLSLKKICSIYTGISDIVLVLGAEKKSAIKLPFGVDLSKELITELSKLLGDDKVIVK
jgi:DNA polymerase-3 subunit alpha